jgi:S-DNA-T family DNA segregation ATPase FtsK/SpoIIIE
VLAEEISVDDLPPEATLGRLPVGLGTGEGTVVTIDITERHALVCGPYRSGRTTTLSTIVRGLHAVATPPSMHLLAPRRTALSSVPGWTSIARGMTECTTRIDELLGVAEARDPDHPEGTIVIAVDDAGELSDMQIAAKLERLVRLGRDVEIRVVAAAETAVVRGIGGPSWLRELRKDANGILLRPEFPDDSSVLNVQLPRRARVNFPAGRGVAISGGTVSVVQIAH